MKTGLILNRNRSGSVVIGKLVVGIVRDKAQVKWRVTTGVLRCRQYSGLWIRCRLFAIISGLSLAAASV